MMYKFALVLLSTLAQTTVLVESTRLGRTAQGGDGKMETQVKMMQVQVDESIAPQDDEAIDEDDSPSFIPGLRALRRENNAKVWNHGTFEVAAKRRGSIEVCAPSATQDGDTLFFFLR
jgi:hypothetical protein